MFPHLRHNALSVFRRITRPAGGSASPRAGAGVPARKRFLWNLVLFLIIGIVLQFAELTLPGRKALDAGFDYLAKADYRWAIQENREKETVGPKLRLVLFTADDYTRSYTKGYWTPRDTVGLTLLNCIKLGASAVLVDFSFAGVPPLVLQDGAVIDGQTGYLRFLEAAAEAAAKRNARIYVPVPDPAGNVDAAYLNLLGKYGHVVKQANFSASKDGYDQVVRRFMWFDRAPDGTLVLSAHLRAVLEAGVDERLAALRIAEAEALLEGKADTGPPAEPAPQLAPELAEALRPENRELSSRILYRILPRLLVRKVLGSGDMRLRDVVWRPDTINLTAGNKPDFSGKIVLIGSDYAPNGDVHRSVFGPLAGSYLLANSLDMLLENRLSRESRPAKLLFTAALGVAFSFLYAALPAFWTAALLSAFCVAAPMVSSALFNSFGIFFDVWLPVVGIGLYNAVTGLGNWKRNIAVLPVWQRIRERRSR
jgi:hypothetical protein